MPIYEFRCPKCSKKEDYHPFEIFYRGRGLPEFRKCPDCGSISPRIFSSYNFQFSPYLKELGGGNMVSY